MPITDPIAAISLADEAALLRVAIRRLARAHPDDTATDLADLKRQAQSLSLSLRGGPESALADTLDQLVVALSEDTPPAA